MPETDGDSTTEVTETETETTDDQSQDTEPDLAEEVEKWKALARKNEARAKENAQAAKRLKEIEDADKTEAQKLAEELEQLRSENESLKVSTLRSQVAAEKGVPAALLSGSTQEELEASADALLGWKGDPPKAPSADGQGNAGSTVSQGEMSAAEIVAKATGR